MEEERVLSLTDVFKIIFKRVWWVVGVTLVCLAASMLIFGMWYNKSKQVYAVSYQINYPNKSTGKYPFGGDFDYLDGNTLEVLNGLKEREEFAAVDTEGLFYNDGIIISPVKESTSYRISVKAKYFKSSNQASAFLKAVAEYPITRINKLVSEHDYNENFNYDNAESYENKINQLVEQKKYIANLYSTVQEVGGNVVSSRLLALENVFTEAQQKVLRQDLATNFFVLNPEEYIANARNAITSYVYEIEAYNTRIAQQDKLLANAPTDSQVIVYGEIKAQLLDEQAKLVLEINKMLSTLKAMGCTSIPDSYAVGDTVSIDYSALTVSEAYKSANNAFKAKLDAYKEDMAAATQTLKETATSLYSANSKVVYSANRIELEGGVHLALAAVIGALAGFIIVSLVVYFVDSAEYRRKKFDGEKAEDSADNKQPEKEKE